MHALPWLLGCGSAGFDVLQPTLQQGGGAPISAMGSSVQQQNPGEAAKVLTGDLDSSLASLAQNLSINKGGQTVVKGVQWNSPKNVAKPGTTGWSPQPMAATTGANYRPMGHGMPTMNSTPQFPAVQPLGMQPMPGMRPPLMGGAAGMMGGGGAMMGSPRIGGVVGQQPPTQQSPGAVPLDPFGAL